MKNELITIKCPVCGTEYLPSEIYLPNSFFGKQKDISRKPSGEIDYYLGDDMDLNEEFLCENCFTKLKIHAKLSFDVTTQEEENFDEDYSSKLNKPKKIKLSEEALF